MKRRLPPVFEHFKLSAQFWLNDLMGRTHQAPTTLPGMKNVLAIVIKHGNDFLFLNVPAEGSEIDGSDGEVRPILVDVDDVMEHQLTTVRAYCRQQFRANPEAVRFSPYTFNLAPIKRVKFYMALVELPEDAFQRIKAKFSTVSASKVLLNRDSNIFFEALARDVEEVLVA